ncbi:4Fe-4S binding protein [Methanohalobium sp.]|uniref:4Fe-4S binding protein n=1 Tax=Methanohalobium sp. TaxID=2837493 RepID=UPI0025E56A37|nr:4Fe-4S binding protein [Methanohalobium sp.]
MPAVVDSEICTGCEACVDECPVDAISMNDDGIAVVDEEECTDCEACIDICPVEAISMK